MNGALQQLNNLGELAEWRPSSWSYGQFFKFPAARSALDVGVLEYFAGPELRELSREASEQYSKNRFCHRCFSFGALTRSRQARSGDRQEWVVGASVSRVHSSVSSQILLGGRLKLRERNSPYLRVVFPIEKRIAII
jgi:hypothetical protein